MNDIEQVLLFQIDKTNKIAKIHSQKEFDRLGMGITVEQWVLLKIIHENEDIAQKELARMSFRDPASITRTLALVEKKGLIDRSFTPENRRQRLIKLSAEGKTFVEQYFPVVKRLRKESMKGISEEELMLLNEVLKRVQQNMT